MIDWLFRNRETGHLTIGQFPNVALWVFIAAAALRAVFSPAGDVGSAVDLIATGALVVWAADELIRGVNPWRRFLGAGMLAYVVFGLLSA